MNDTETKAPTLASTRARYPQIARVPDPSSTDLGEQLGKYLAMIGQRRAFLGAWSADDAEAAGIAMAAVLLWHRLDSYADEDKSERAARDIAEAWAEAEGVTKWLNKFARRFGFEPAEVVGVAATEHGLMLARARDAEHAAVETATALALARQAVEALGKLADSHERVLYAVSVDLARGDADAARGLLWEQLDGFDGEPAGEGETGMEYLNRLRDGRKAEAGAEAKPEPAAPAGRDGDYEQYADSLFAPVKDEVARLRAQMEDAKPEPAGM
jgi:hypothetical protein